MKQRKVSVSRVFQTIRQHGKKPTCSTATAPVQHNDGRPCNSVHEKLECWHSHYNALNHAPANSCPELDSAALNATPDTSIPDDVPTLDEVHRAT